MVDFVVGEPSYMDTSLKELGIDHVSCKWQKFKDQEGKPVIEDYKKLENRDVVLFLRKRLEEEPNLYLQKFKLMAFYLKENAKCNHVTGVMPYLPYSRQDKAFSEEEPVSIDMIAEELSSRVDSFVTVSPHFQRGEGKLERFSNDAYCLSGFKMIGDGIESIAESWEIEDLVVMSPDSGNLEQAKTLAQRLNCDFDYFEKSRDDSGISIKDKSLDLEGKDVIIPDDILNSGDTMISATGKIINESPRSIVVAFVHGVFNNSSETLRDFGERMWLMGKSLNKDKISLRAIYTDTILGVNFPSPLANISTSVKIVPYVAEYLKSRVAK